MKILVVSLLRLGDVLIAYPALVALRNKHPKAKIHLLVNLGLKAKLCFLTCVDEIKEFPRDYLQDSMRIADRPLFEALDITEKIIEDLQSQGYELVVNLTQNHLSGYLVAGISAPQTVGLKINERDHAEFGSSWMSYLNNYVAGGANNPFHYSDIFYSSISEEPLLSLPKLTETEAGRAELEDLHRKYGYTSKYRIVVQAFTSDVKKNWGIDNWVALLKNLYLFERDVHFILLGAPNEADGIQNILGQLRNLGIPATPALLSFEGALSLLNHSDLLITGDTSIKHLATYTEANVLELALGSSDPRKTGSYKNGATIITSRAPCSPCSHRDLCTQATHECGEKLAPEAVALVAKNILHRSQSSIKLIALEYSDEMTVFTSQRSGLGFNYLYQYGSGHHIHEFIDKAAWRFYLNSEHKNLIGKYGSAMAKARDDMGGTLFAEPETIKLAIEQIEKDSTELEEQLGRLLRQLQRSIRAGQWGDFITSELMAQIPEIENRLGVGPCFNEKLNQRNALPFVQLRQVQSLLGDMQQLQEIKLKITRELRNQWVEGKWQNL